MKKWTNELNRAFSKEEVSMAKVHMKQCLPFLTRKEEIKIKCILRFHLIPVIIATIKNTNENKCCQGYGD
jgi:hypothetical protein